MDLDDLLAPTGVLRAPARTARHALARRLTAKGLLAPVLPGVYARSGTETASAIRAAAICARDPSAVLTGRAAAALHLFEDDWPTLITFASARQWRIERSWLAPTRSALCHDHVGHLPLPHVDRATAALQIATTDGPGVLHDGLRERQFTVRGLEAALVALSGTDGNTRRRRLVERVLLHPWSGGEQELQDLLRARGITGWVGNPLVRARGRSYYPDVAFPAQKVAIEFDGWEFHRDKQSFEKDRRRHNDLTAAGWTVLRVTWDMVHNHPDEVVARVRAALARRD